MCLGIAGARFWWLPWTVGVVSSCLATILTGSVWGTWGALLAAYAVAPLLILAAAIFGLTAVTLVLRAVTPRIGTALLLSLAGWSLATACALGVLGLIVGAVPLQIAAIIVPYAVIGLVTSITAQLATWWCCRRAGTPRT